MIKERLKKAVFKICNWCDRQIILSMIRQGYSDGEIAVEVGVSVRYVEKVRNPQIGETKTFQMVFYEVVGEEENNLDETIEYRKTVTKLAQKVVDRWYR